jgi:hypothetical protein
MTVKPLCDYSIHILHWRYDTWIKEGDLPSLNDEDVAWFRDEVGLSLDDLHRICAGRGRLCGSSSRVTSYCI